MFSVYNPLFLYFVRKFDLLQSYVLVYIKGKSAESWIPYKSLEFQGFQVILLDSLELLKIWKQEVLNEETTKNVIRIRGSQVQF